MTRPTDRVEAVVNPYQSPLAEPFDPAPRGDWPLWVRVGLWKVRTRAMARVYLSLSLALLAVSACYAFWPGLIFLAAVYWYWEAIRWVDEFGRWE